MATMGTSAVDRAPGSLDEMTALTGILHSFRGNPRNPTRRECRDDQKRGTKTASRGADRRRQPILAAKGRLDLPLQMRQELRRGFV